MDFKKAENQDIERYKGKYTELYDALSENTGEWFEVSLNGIPIAGLRTGLANRFGHGNYDTRKKSESVLLVRINETEGA